MKKNKSIINKFRYAWEGIVYALKTQGNMRFHFLAAGLVIAAALILKVDRISFAVLLLVIISVIVAETLNTAVETVVDMVTREYYPLAKIAKDVAAGAVLLAAINAVIIGIIIFWPYLHNLISVCF